MQQYAEEDQTRMVTHQKKPYSTVISYVVRPYANSHMYQERIDILESRVAQLEKEETSFAAESRLAPKSPTKTFLTSATDEMARLADVAGMSRVGDRRLGSLYRLTWLLIIVCLLGVTSVMVTQRVRLYISDPVITSIHFDHERTLMPVPRIALCHVVYPKDMKKLFRAHPRENIRYYVRNDDGLIEHSPRAVKADGPILYSEQRFVASCAFTPVVLINSYQFLRIDLPFGHLPRWVFVLDSEEYSTASYLPGLKMLDAIEYEVPQNWRPRNDSTIPLLQIDMRINEMRLVRGCYRQEANKYSPKAKCRLQCLARAADQLCKPEPNVTFESSMNQAAFLEKMAIPITEAVDSHLSRSGGDSHWCLFEQNLIDKAFESCVLCKDRCREINYNVVTRTILDDLDGEPAIDLEGREKGGAIEVRLRDRRARVTEEKFQFATWTDYMSDLGGTMGGLVGG